MGDESVLERILNRDEEPKDLPLALLQRITNDFSEEKKIGQGGFGEVYKGELRNGIIVAVKRIEVNQITIDDVSFRREFHSLMNTNHQNVVRFLGFCSNTHHTSRKEDGEINLVNVRERLLCFEYINNGSLDKYITDELSGLEWETRYEIIIGICKGLLYLHEEKNIVHMDLKPGNILLDGTYMVPKIIDFGLSRSNKNSHTVGLRFGTQGYVAPEYNKYGKTSFKCDIYSLGVIIIELVTGCKSAPHKNNVLRRWRHRWSKPPRLLQFQQVTRCIDIAVRCRQQEPEHRPSISEVISTLTESESTDGHNDQMSLRFDEDDMLGIKPLELRIPSELEEISWFTVELTNDTHSCIAFNIQLPRRQKYNAQPDKGIVQPESKCGVKITVQGRDPHEHDHGDKFIVQSMKLSDDVRDKVITESMFHEEAGKVVDEVNLMVVYEPKNTPKHLKCGEYTNMASEEVLEEIEREIVESASGKGKVGSSENIDVTSMDINSRVQGQCNFYPPQSFARQYPTNMKYLGKESDRAVDVKYGAMGSLLDKLGKLVIEDYNLEKIMKKDIESFSEELTKIHLDLRKLEKLDGAKVWVDEVRELSYTIEDMVDSFLVNVKPESSSSASAFWELPHEGLDILEIADVIRDIKNRVHVVAYRGKKYVDALNVVANATARATIDLRIPTIYEDQEQFVGIKAPRDELITLFEEDGLVSKQKLKILSILGMGGLGKTALAKAVYDKVRSQYHPRAFVPVGQNPDVEIVLKNILVGCQDATNLEHLDVCQLINHLQTLLKDKRYFIVIDDIWDSSVWGLINSAFPRNKRGSRVIATTRIEGVARDCCKLERKYIYRMKPLSEEDSRTLFLRRIFGPGRDCPDAQKEISTDILKRCGGMPLAINSIASLLAGEPASTWDYVRKNIGRMTEGDDLENMKKILDLSYIHLPDHLKTCLLYVSLYPEDREIDKNDLLRKWVAEGFVHVSTNGGLDAEDVAEKYFKDLISMCMIEPKKIDCNGEVLSCRVHDIILDLMRSKSSKQNFIHVIDGSKDARGGMHRVSVHCNDKDTRIFETIYKGSLSHVRSVFLYRISLVPYILEFKYVRVLHLEHKLPSTGLDLTSISRLFLLRYLKVTSADESGYELELPKQIGDLRQLETIDLHNAFLKNYPSDIVSLPWLSYLSSTGNKVGVVLPDRIEMLKSLCTLVGVDVFGRSAEYIKGISKLNNLRKLHISLVGIEQATIMHMDALHSSISMLSANLRILTFDEGRVGIDWSRALLLPEVSHIRELDLGGFEFERFPEWIGQLHHLYKLRIVVCEVADGISIVARLPSLAYFDLNIFQNDVEKEESVIIPGGAFQALKELIFYCPKASLIFEPGAMPKLQNLSIGFRYQMACQYLPVGVEHLPTDTLEEIWLCVLPENDRRVEDSQVDAQHMAYVRNLLKGAFKPHHPGAMIVFVFDSFPVDIDQEDDEEGSDNEDDGEEDSDNEATSSCRIL